MNTRPPDLQQLVADHGGYDKIPPEAWAEYDNAVAAWHAQRRERLLDERAQNRSNTQFRRSK